MAESQASLDIFNLALGHIGNKSITTASGSPVCQLYYPFVRDKMLSWAPWTFNTTRKALDQLTVAPVSEFTFQYRLPTEPFVLRIRDINNRRVRYQREVYYPVGDPLSPIPVLLTDEATAIVKYNCRVDEGLWPPMFTDTCALWLAANIAQKSTDKTSLRAQLFTEMTVQLDRLIDIDGHEDSAPRAVLNESYILTRLDGGMGQLEDAEEALVDPF